MKPISALRVFLILTVTAALSLPARADGPLYGIERMRDLKSLPVLDHGVRVGYEGSIDKQGGNADWDWWLYEDERQEWVIFDVEGPGCIYNFVQHRYLSSTEPTFRFYFDGEAEPRFTISLSEFGEKYPFLTPLADSYIGPLDGGRGPIRVVRSFAPMPFQKGCRITSDIKLEGFDRALGHGGWGHVVYHSFTSGEGVRTFSPEDYYYDVIHMWKRRGGDPKPAPAEGRDVITHDLTLEAGASATLTDIRGEGYVGSVKLYMPSIERRHLEELWITLSWDGSPEPDVSCPIGAFFGNSLGYNDTQFLLMGMDTEGWMYNYFPMPFWESARIVIENRGSEPAAIALAAVGYSPEAYPRAGTGYFRSGDYYTRKHTPGADSRIGTASGHGKMVAAHVTCFGERQNIITCEGDVRVYVDGNRTPQVESDGSESYVCYGWGFPTPAEMHPAGGYDGLSDNPWSMTRLLLGDSYPFYDGIDFRIESGEQNNQYLEHSGIIFYYGGGPAAMTLTDSLDLACPASVSAHSYVTAGKAVSESLVSYFEGDEDDVEVAGTVYRFSDSSSFRVAVTAANRGVKLRRMSDQSAGRQKARVYVDGREVTERAWYYADRNTYKRWLEDEFDIPQEYTAGKEQIEITIRPEAASDGAVTWNEAGYTVYSFM